MSKVIPVALAAHMALPATTLCQCLKITRRDAQVFGLTTLDVPITVSGQVYVPGLEVSNLVSTSGLGVDNLDLTILPDDDALLEADILAGLWDNCTFEIFQCNYLAPADGIDMLKRGTGGETRVGDNQYVLELRGLTQALQQTVGIATSRTCRAHFADYPQQVLSARCGLSAAAFTVTGTITNVTSRQLVTDSARAEASDWFGDGFVKFTSGLNAGYERQVRSFASGAFTFVQAFPFDIDVGDAYSAIACCRKRHDVDCRDKFSNILNFQGEPHLPGVDTLTSLPGTDG